MVNMAFFKGRSLAAMQPVSHKLAGWIADILFFRLLFSYVFHKGNRCEGALRAGSPGGCGAGKGGSWVRRQGGLWGRVCGGNSWERARGFLRPACICQWPVGAFLTWGGRDGVVCLKSREDDEEDAHASELCEEPGQAAQLLPQCLQAAAGAAHCLLTLCSMLLCLWAQEGLQALRREGNINHALSSSSGSQQ